MFFLFAVLKIYATSNSRYVLTLSPLRDIIIFTHFIHWCTPIDTYFATVDKFLRIFLFYNTNSAIYSLFLIFMRFFIKWRETILLFVLYFLPFSTYFFTFGTQMVYCRDTESNVYHISEKSGLRFKFPRRRCCKSLASFLASEAHIFPKICG